MDFCFLLSEDIFHAVLIKILNRFNQDNNN